MAAWPRTTPARASSIACWRTLVEGLRVVSVLLWPYLPASTEKLLRALGAPDVALAGARLGAGAIGRVTPIEPLFPKSADAAEAARSGSR